MSGTPTVEDDTTIESCSSGPATPMVPSNPGTPRSIQDAGDFRNTPPPPPQQATALTHSASSSSLSGMTHSASSTSLVSQVQRPKHPPGFGSQQMAQQTQAPQSKYTQLLAVIEDLGKDIRPTYSGSRTSAERLKRGIVHSRILVRECLMECERAARS